MTDLAAYPAKAPAWKFPAQLSVLRKLYVQVLIAVAVGVLLGVAYPGFAVDMKPLSDAFITLIRAVVPPIVFATVAVGIAKMGDMRRVGIVGVRALVYFEVVSTIALIVGLVVGNLWQPGAGLHKAADSLDASQIAGYVNSAKSFTIIDFLMKMIPSNLVGAVAQGDLLPVLVMAVLFGFALCQMGERGQRLVAVIDDVMHALFGIVRIVMYVAPLAAFGAIAFTVGKFGFGILINLAQLVASVYVTSILFVLIGFGGIAWLFGLPLLKIIRYFKDELLIAFTATSGEAMIPRSIVKLRRMGCTEETVGLVLSTGFSFNTDGTAIYMTIAVLFIAQALDIQLSLGQQLMMLFVMLFTAKGAAGVAGAGFVALAATLPTLGLIPAAGLTLLLGVERFMSEIRAVTNLFSNIFATVVVSKWMGELDDRRLCAVLDDGDQDTTPEQPKVAASAAPTVVLTRSAGKTRPKAARSPA
jgi:aerobic C4-dicarboxylate transport protein